MKNARQVSLISAHVKFTMARDVLRWAPTADLRDFISHEDLADIDAKLKKWADAAFNEAYHGKKASK